jgi:hypothetical protein
MKRPWTQWAFNFSVIGAVVLVLAGAGWLFAKAIQSGSTFLTAFMAAIATVATVLVGRYHERRKEAEAVRRAELGDVYEKIAGVMSGQVGSPRSQEKMIRDFFRKGLIYAGPSVVSAFRLWRDNLHDDDSPRAEVRASMLRFESLIKAMRKDLGISNWMLQEGDLLRVALTDFDVEFPSEASVVDELIVAEAQHEPRMVATAKREP